MKLAIIDVLLVINTVILTTENPIKSYRFEVFPVDKCPENASEFETASERRNCTQNSRYLCAPDRYLTSLIEFCTDRRISLFEKDNCLRLEGTGDLNQLNCVDKFISGCPLTPYTDEEIYQYPACLAINRDHKCFLAEKNCPEERTYAKKERRNSNILTNEENEINQRGSFGTINVAVLLFLMCAVGITIFLYFKRRKMNAGTTKIEEEEKLIEERTLREFLSKGTLSICHSRCIIVGCAGAGKTTLLRRLGNASYKELMKIKSTEIADVHVNHFEVLKNESIEGVKRKNDLPTIIFSTDMIENKINTLESKEVQSKSSNDTEDRNSDDETNVDRSMNEMLPLFEEVYTPTIQDEIEEENGQQLPSPSGEVLYKRSFASFSEFQQIEKAVDNEMNHDQNIDEKYAISKIVDDIKELSTEQRLLPRITFLDFAGQSLYYAFHQIYLSPKTLYILVVDMTKRHCDTVPETEEECGSQFESWTYEEYYRFWLKSIDSHSDPSSQVIIVGTHAEGMSNTDCRRFFHEFSALFDSSRYPDLRRHLHIDRLYPIRFPEPGSELDDLKDIKQCIACLVPDPDIVRPVWAIFEHILNREKKQKIILRKTLSKYNEQLSRELQMDDDEITQMLLFLHRVGTLLYFDEENLRETIILDIQWFSNAFKCIMNYNISISNTDVKRERFKNTGEIADQDLNEIWENKENGEYILHKRTILYYMEQLGLLAESTTNSLISSKNTTWYYIPCMNKRKFEYDDKGFTKSSILCFEFDKNGQLPIFLFHGVVLKCMKIQNWCLLKEGDQNCIYGNAACFSLKHVIVAMCICKFQIQVQIWLPEPSSGNVSIGSTLLEKIQKSVEEIIKGYKRYSFRIGYKCQNGVFNDESDHSFIAREKFPVTDLICKKCKVVKKHFIDNKICWVHPKEHEIQACLTEISDHSKPFLPNRQEGPCEMAVRRSFVVLKEHLPFDILQDEFFSRNLLSQYEIDKIMFNDSNGYFKTERFLKLMIRMKRCKDFIACIKEEKHLHDTFSKNIYDALERTEQPSHLESFVETCSFIVTDGLLRKYFNYLYIEIEPRAVADELFQAGFITISEHDDVSNIKQKYKRLKNLLDILKNKNIYSPFLWTLKSLNCSSVLETLQTNTEKKAVPSENAMYIQRNFTTLLQELPDIELVASILQNVLDSSDMVDINSCPGRIRQLAKLLKILMMKGKPACDELLTAIKAYLKREDLIIKMKKKHVAIERRGKPDLSPRLKSLKVSCLQDHEGVIYDELDATGICDHLFEERAMDIPTHDRITETSSRTKQIRYLLETLKENKNDCFYFFLYILEREGFHVILDKIEKFPKESYGTNTSIH